MRNVKTLALAMFLGLAAASPVQAQPAGSTTMGDTTSPALAPMEAVKLAEMVGSEVVTTEGETIGVLTRVLAGESGLAAAIIEIGETGEGQDTGVVVPVDRLRIDADRVVLEMTPDEFEGLPAYEETN